MTYHTHKIPVTQIIQTGTMNKIEYTPQKDDCQG